MEALLTNYLITINVNSIIFQNIIFILRDFCKGNLKHKIILF